MPQCTQRQCARKLQYREAKPGQLFSCMLRCAMGSKEAEPASDTSGGFFPVAFVGVNFSITYHASLESGIPFCDAEADSCHPRAVRLTLALQDGTTSVITLRERVAFICGRYLLVVLTGKRFVKFYISCRAISTTKSIAKVESVAP